MSEHHESDQIAIRREKLERLRSLGVDPFAVETFHAKQPIAHILERWDSLQDKELRTAGRLVAFRKMGKASFAHLADETGKIQLYFKLDDLGPDNYDQLDLLDLSDILGVTGTPFITKTGEKTLHITSFQLLAKALRPIQFGKEKDGESWNTMADVELRYRHRSIDFNVNPDVRAVFHERGKVVNAVRRVFNERGYLEVETPVLQAVAGGAIARPFLTHHNALGIDLKLRISLELYLKRLIIGGFEKVYEIGRVFRNEGISTRHNPEFTLLESYEAYSNLEDIMSLTEEIVCEAARAVHGKLRIPDKRGGWLDITPPWPRLELLHAVEQFAGVSRDAFSNLQTARDAVRHLDLTIVSQDTPGHILEKVAEKCVHPQLERPTFLVDFPVEISPLAKKHPQKPGFARRFELFVAGQELANAFSELNDPIDQRERFAEQVKQHAQGNEEAHPMDEEFLYAMEHGMPPCGGLGIGIDRLVMVICGEESIRDVLLFPLMKPE